MNSDENVVGATNLFLESLETTSLIYPQDKLYYENKEKIICVFLKNIIADTVKVLLNNVNSIDKHYIINGEIIVDKQKLGMYNELNLTDYNEFTDVNFTFGNSKTININHIIREALTKISSPTLNYQFINELIFKIEHELNYDESIELLERITSIKENLKNKTNKETAVKKSDLEINHQNSLLNKETKNKDNIFHSEKITEKKSIFQAHAAKITTRVDVEKILSYLLLDQKIATATHNIVAYRIKNSSGGHTADFDSDGEDGAGNAVHWLLNTINATNVVVIVSRWYGGTKLGSKRFKIINSLARKVLQDNNLLENEKKN